MLKSWKVETYMTERIEEGTAEEGWHAFFWIWEEGMGVVINGENSSSSSMSTLSLALRKEIFYSPRL